MLPENVSIQVDSRHWRVGLSLGHRGCKFRVLISDVPWCVVVDAWPWRAALRQLRLGAKESEGRVVVTDELGRRALIGMCLARLARCRFVVRLRGDFYTEERDRYLRLPNRRKRASRMMRGLLARWILRGADGALFNSKHLARVYAGRLRDTAVTAVVHNPYTPPKHPVEPPLELSATGGLKLLTVTNFGLWSKVEPLFDAIENWLDMDLAAELDLTWFVFGDKHYANSFRECVARRGLSSYVKCIGYEPNLGPYYAWCDALVHLSGLDAFPNVTMEAMVAGKPVVTNPESCGTLEQVIDGYNGNIVNSGESFAAILRRYARDRVLRECYGERGRELVLKMFSVEAERERLSTFFATL